MENQNQGIQDNISPQIIQQSSIVFPPIKISEWILTYIIVCIPIVGFIMMFVWAFDRAGNPNKVNWAKANLILTAIFVILGFLMLLFVFSTLTSSMHFFGKQQELTNQKITMQDQNLNNKNTINNKEDEQQKTPNNPLEAVKVNLSNWKIYTDSKYSYQFQYPAGWNLAENSNSSNAYNVTVWKGDGFNKDNIQIVKVVYGVNADGSVGSRESYLKMLAEGEFSKISIGNGRGYYYLAETKGGFSPSIYLIGDKEIFLMNYNIYEASILEAETLLKQVAGTFKF